MLATCKYLQKYELVIQDKRFLQFTMDVNLTAKRVLNEVMKLA